MTKGLWLAMGLGLALAAGAQEKTSAGAEQLSPAAAYKDAMRPLEMTRRSVANWSDTEQSALAVAIKQGSVACAARKVEEFAGDGLVDMARLCALGLQWPKVVDATTRYLAEPGEKTLLAEAYAGKMDAELHLKDEAAAAKTMLAMLGSVKYTALVAESSNEAIDYMELLYTPDAIAIAEARQPKVLELLGEAGEVPAVPVGMGVAELYRQGLVLGGLKQLAGHAASAVSALAALEAALPKEISRDDAIRNAAARRRYGMVGRPLSGLDVQGSLQKSGGVPVLPARGAITALLLFPDWCAQCVELARHIPEGVFTVEGHEAYTYGLLAQTMPPVRGPARSEKGGFDPALAAVYLSETATMTVGTEVLERFDASEVPLLIVTDANGIVRLIQPVDEAALAPGNTVDTAIAVIGRRWPAVVRAPARRAPVVQGQSARPAI